MNANKNKMSAVKNYKYCSFLDESDRRKKHATTEGEKAGIEIRYMEIRRQMKIKK